MPRIRTVKPEFFDDEKLSHVSLQARLTFIGMLVQSDDYGVVKGHNLWLKNQIFPYDDIKLPVFEAWIKELESILCIVQFSNSGETFYYIRKFLEHQKVEKPSKWRNCEPPENITQPLPDSSPTPPLLLPVVKEGIGIVREGIGRVKGETKTPLPHGFNISDRVRKWAEEKGKNHLDEHLESFMAKCLANGYKYADWDAAFMEAIRGDWAKIGNGDVTKNKETGKGARI